MIKSIDLSPKTKVLPADNHSTVVAHFRWSR